MKKIILILTLACIASLVMAQGWGVSGSGKVKRSVAVGSTAPWYLSGGIASSNCVAAYQAKGAASLGTSYTNLNNPGSNTMGVGVAPTWNSATGWVFNGSSQYLSYGKLPSSLNSYIIRFSGGSATPSVSQLMFGATDNATYTFGVMPNYNASGSLCGMGTVNSYNLPGTTSGIYCMTPSALYYNGTNIANWTSSFPGGNVFAPLIGAFNVGGSVEYYWPGNIQAYASYNTTLTSNQVLQVTTAMAAL